MKYIIHPTPAEEERLIAFLEAEDIIYYTEDLPDFMLHEKKDQDELKAKNNSTLSDLRKRLEEGDDDGE
ncbi:hypothetical protein [Mucilaginibacter myungsuensis]|uniref:Uncharacterized protein n=1 Tax=Mucilaginibacter myungsuensis TaxID=649104 RepID=A0A929PY07_9SPHI|nr:hypothetical protein [Mucilaginibacter myungsuensis]MBE9664398.1 hypothetical protein [Mucilaginibacter myungsuensis]MDN3597109.1 hypothetical protein [Mucilaginibacter myungsuensis]